MSNTRAAIRELRSLSEKRSRGALSEPEAARWTALRRQLGLPPEPANAEVGAEALSAEPLPPVSEPAVPAAAPLPSAPASGGAAVGPANSVSWEQAPASSSSPSGAPSGSPAAGATEPDAWTGPSLDSPAAPVSSSWVGPAIDAPAWSDTAAERPTDPGLEEPPPAPFDEAPAARPLQEVRTIDLGGAPDEPVQLAPAADFISYAREGNEAIELPPDTGSADTFEPKGLAELSASAAPSAESPTSTFRERFSATAVAAAQGEGAVSRTPAPFPLETVAPETAANQDGAFRVTHAPLPRETVAPETVAAPQGAFPVTPAPLPLETLAPETAAAPQGGFPVTPAPLRLETLAPETAATAEGAFPLTPTPLPLETLGPEPVATPEGAFPLTPAPLPVETVAPEVAAGPPAPATSSDEPAPFASQLESSGDELPDAMAASPVSTWAPGSAEPPRLGVEEFGRPGGALGKGDLDPWPEPLPTGAPAEEAVETVSDEDLVEELATPTPLPPFPVAAPPGSGGIRGFQFPKPPPGPVPVPVPPTPPSWRRTEPGLPSFATSGALRAPLPSAGVAPTTPVPQGPRAVPTPVAPKPGRPAPSPSALSPAAVAPATPVPTTYPTRPVLAAATVPVTPPPVVPASPVPPRTTTPAATARAPVLAPSEGTADKSSGRKLNAAPSAPLRAPPALQPVATTEEEASMPLLELVDEVEPPRPGSPSKARSAPTPPAGTHAVFGPPMMLNPGFVDGEHRVVIHTLEGQVHRGTVHDLDLQDEALPLQQPDGRSVRIPTRRLKAVFFVLAPGGKHPPTRGERVQVTFRDGRQVVGYSEDHAGEEPGFFVVPSDARTNTARVYVYRGGVQSITTG